MPVSPCFTSQGLCSEHLKVVGLSLQSCFFFVVVVFLITQVELWGLLTFHIFQGVLFCSPLLICTPPSPLLRHTRIEDLLIPLRCRQHEWSFQAKHRFCFCLYTGFQTNCVNAWRPARWSTGVRLFWLWPMVPNGVSRDHYLHFISKKGELLLFLILQ